MEFNKRSIAPRGDAQRQRARAHTKWSSGKQRDAVIDKFGAYLAGLQYWLEKHFTVSVANHGPTAFADALRILNDLPPDVRDKLLGRVFEGYALRNALRSERPPWSITPLEIEQDFQELNELIDSLLL